MNLVKKIIDTIEKKCDNIDDKFNKFRRKLFTNLGNEVMDIRLRYIKNEKNKRQFKYLDFIDEIKDFYYIKLEKFCDKNNLNFIDELLLRRYEIQFQSKLSIDGSIGFLTGFLSGYVVNNIAVIKKFIMNMGESTAKMIFSYLILFIGVFIVWILVFGIIKVINNIENVSFKYAEERELSFINDILKYKVEE